jgi:hypothetical protein
VKLRSKVVRMEVDTMSGPPTLEVKVEEDSQKGEKATYKSFKYVFTSSWIPHRINVLPAC